MPHRERVSKINQTQKKNWNPSPRLWGPPRVSLRVAALRTTSPPIPEPHSRGNQGAQLRPNPLRLGFPPLGAHWLELPSTDPTMSSSHRSAVIATAVLLGASTLVGVAAATLRAASLVLNRSTSAGGLALSLIKLACIAWVTNMLHLTIGRHFSGTTVYLSDLDEDVMTRPLFTESSRMFTLFHSSSTFSDDRHPLLLNFCGSDPFICFCTALRLLSSYERPQRTVHRRSRTYQLGASV